MLYGTAQDGWACTGVHQREARLLKFFFVLIARICSCCWCDLSPNHTQASSWRVLVGTGRNTAMEQAKNEAVCAEIHLVPYPTVSVWLKREKLLFVCLFFFPDHVK